MTKQIATSQQENRATETINISCLCYYTINCEEGFGAAEQIKWSISWKNVKELGYSVQNIIMWTKKTEIKAGHWNPYDKKVHRKVFDFNLILYFYF